MRTWLDEPSFDLSDERRAKLHEWLYTNLPEEADLRTLVRKAGVPAHRIRFGQGINHVWLSTLDAAANAGTLRALLNALLSSPDYKAFIGPLTAILGGGPLAAAGRDEGNDDQTTDAGGAAFEWRGDSRPLEGGNEAMISNALMDVGFLDLGRQRADSVVHLEVDGMTFGTGALIGRELVLTNHHVLFGDDGTERAGAVVVGFRFDKDRIGQEGGPRETREGDVSTIVGDKDLDWAVVALKKPAPADVPVLVLTPSRIRVNQRAHIIQHPGGGRKRVALFKNDVRYVDDKVVQYVTDTHVGSSGAPVFNDKWETVALHHAWKRIPRPGDEPLDVNEGIAMERVITGLREAGVVFDKQGARLVCGGYEAHRKGKATAAKQAESRASGAAGAQVAADKKEPGKVRAKVYISRDSSDAKLVEELEKTLAPIAASMGLDIWHRGKLSAGEFVSERVQRELREATIFALVASASALASDEVQAEWKLAVERQAAGTAKSIAILAKSSLVKYSIAKNLLFFPKDTVALDMQANRPQALNEIVEEILSLV